MATTLAPHPRESGDREAAAGFSIVCLSPQEWRETLPTNRQQIMVRAAVRGHEVIFLETGHFLGKHLVQLLRGSRRRSLAARLAGTERVAERVRARKALNVAPFGQRRAWAGSINRRLTGLVVRRLVRKLPRPVVLWVYDPCAFGRPGEYGEDMVVYDCVDDYSEQAAESAREMVAAADARVAEHARLVFATTTPLSERHARVNPRTHLVRNVGDYAHFAPAARSEFAAEEVAGLQSPVVGFAGNLVSTKVDFDLLDAMADARPDWTLVLVGPARSDAAARIHRLTEKPNVRWLGPKDYAELPRYVAGFDVGLIPYVTTAYTRSCFPLKLFEYLAAEKPVVATGLPELRGMEPDVLVVDGVEDVVGAVESTLRSDPTDRARRSALAAANTWESRTERLLELISHEIDVLREAA